MEVGIMFVFVINFFKLKYDYKLIQCSHLKIIICIIINLFYRRYLNLIQNLCKMSVRLCLCLLVDPSVWKCNTDALHLNDFYINYFLKKSWNSLCFATNLSSFLLLHFPLKQGWRSLLTDCTPRSYIFGCVVRLILKLVPSLGK